MSAVGFLLAATFGEWCESKLGARVRYKSLISVHMTGCGMVLSMCDSPRVEGDEEGRVQDPADGVVDGLGG